MIEVNDYVRINMDNRNCIGIGRVSRIVNETIYVNMNNKYNLPVSFQIDKIVKHSKQLIDLIEVGDYVNGHLVVDVDDINTGCMREVYCEDDEDFGLWNEHINTIVTKEQYKSVEYIVKEEQ